MWMPPTASLGGVRGPSLGGFVFRGVRRGHAQTAYADVDGLAGRDSSRRRELRSVDPGAAHASEVAQPVRPLLVGDSRVLPRHGKIRELDGALGSTAYRRAGFRYFERRARPTLGLEAQHEPNTRGWRGDPRPSEHRGLRHRRRRFRDRRNLRGGIGLYGGNGLFDRGDGLAPTWSAWL